MAELLIDTDASSPQRGECWFDVRGCKHNTYNDAVKANLWDYAVEKLATQLPREGPYTANPEKQAEYLLNFMIGSELFLTVLDNRDE